MSKHSAVICRTHMEVWNTITNAGCPKCAGEATTALKAQEELLAKRLVEVAQLAAATEREACAKLAEEYFRESNPAGQMIAAAIRARGSK